MLLHRSVATGIAKPFSRRGPVRQIGCWPGGGAERRFAQWNSSTLPCCRTNPGGCIAAKRPLLPAQPISALGLEWASRTQSVTLSEQAEPMHSAQPIALVIDGNEVAVGEQPIQVDFGQDVVTGPLTPFPTG
jgi:hypothetical protein